MLPRLEVMLVVAIEQKSQCGKNLRQKSGFIFVNSG
jgi:hypothetical protein